jgi:type VI protein secretion system component VasF
MAAMEATGKPDAVEQVTERLNHTLDRVDRMTGRNANSQTVNVESKGSTPILLCVMFGVIGALCAAFAVGMAFWLKMDIGEQKSATQAELNRLKEKDEILQAYISRLSVDKQDKAK